ncbi:hypothetical protein [Clostridium cadaveris]|uniref:hypothetical protein n=1 Tax=Clostridium cadaveris TaxID=1529 RepID=UPI0039A2755F
MKNKNIIKSICLILIFSSTISTFNANASTLGTIETKNLIENNEEINHESNVYLPNFEITGEEIRAIYSIPGIGQVALMATGAVLVAGTLYYAGSEIYTQVKQYISKLEEEKDREAYEKAKENGEVTNKHKELHKSGKHINNDNTKGQEPYSSQDLYDDIGLKQRRYFDKDGKAELDIDYKHGGNDKDHKFPHRHYWDWSKTPPRMKDNILKMSVGFICEENEWFYVEDGKIKTGWLTINNKSYYLDPDDGGKRKEGWFYTNSGWYFFDSDSGEKMSGWVYTDNSWYYLDPNDDGKMKTGWFYTDSSWYYLNDSGSMVTGWLEWNNKNYYLGEDGRMQTKWFYTNSGWYFFNPDGGEKMTGWISDNDWYYLDPNNDGKMKTGWLSIGASRYFLNPETGGKMVTGWFYTDSSWYYFYDSGVMARGWLTIGNDRYFLGDNGRMQTGWLSFQGKMYYLYSSGIMARDTNIEGYRINHNGVAVEFGSGAYPYKNEEAA